jgi:hypothetical protein
VDVDVHTAVVPTRHCSDWEVPRLESPDFPSRTRFCVGTLRCFSRMNDVSRWIYELCATRERSEKETSANSKRNNSMTHKVASKMDSRH